jgi:regulator of protease activity HflC (stomatin/prohibitin superfamily)
MNAQASMASARRSTATVSDKPFSSMNGYFMFMLGLLILLIPVWMLLFGPGWKVMIREYTIATVLMIATSSVIAILIFSGLYSVQPNQSVVMLLFGDYRGTDRNAGLRWVNPFTTTKIVSERVNNFITEQIKVNDRNGNPIEIAAAVAWRVSDAAQATLGVEDYAAFVKIQAESAVRHMASEYAYDHGPDEASETITLRSGGDAIIRTLSNELSERLKQAGIEVLETKLTHLAYAPEIASAMLRRQQADAVLSARKKIVEGAVGMVEMALKRLDETQMVELDNERKAAMVSNLLVVLCGERDVTPVINSGTLYQ